MTRRPLLLVTTVSALFGLGCMCGSVGDIVGERVGDQIAEEIAEELVEAATNADEVELSEDGASIKIESPEGQVEFNTEGGSVPEGFPLAVYPGAQVAGSMKSATDGKDGFFVLLTTDASPKEVLAFYEGELKAKELGEVTRTEATEGDKKGYMLAAKGSEMAVMVAIGEEGGKTNAMITMAPNEE